MRKITEKEAIEILKKSSNNEKNFTGILKHSEKVKEIALNAIEDTDFDKEFIATAALLHDIGRYGCPPGSKEEMQHGINGEKILLKEDLPAHAKVARNHIGVGITKKDIEEFKLNMPPENYTPETDEEYIITYADNLDHYGKRRTEEEFLEQFCKRFGEGFRKRINNFHKKVHEIIQKHKNE